MLRSCALILFAKAPEPGRVKTRLLDTVSAAEAAEVQRACIEDAVALAQSLRVCDRFLFASGDPLKMKRFVRRGRGRDTWQVRAQTGRDLGERMENAFEEIFRAGYQRAVVIGTDAPWMRRARIEQALRLLRHATVVLGPTADGGYYLAGATQVVPEMFRGIRWGSGHVFDVTRARLRRAHVSLRLLPPDFDLDRRADLIRAARLLSAHPERARALARLLQKFERRGKLDGPAPRLE